MAGIMRYLKANLAIRGKCELANVVPPGQGVGALAVFTRKLEELSDFVVNEFLAG